MADSKISSLTSASTPLAGTETLPVVQSGATKQVSVANLTAGRAVSAAEMTLSTGNLVQGTAAKGINFTANTPAAGMTSQLLNWYEEGTWTVTWTNLTGTPTNFTGYYTRIGRTVYFTYATGAGAISGSAGNVHFNLPFTPAQQGVGTSLAEGPGTPVLNWIYTDGNCYPIGFGAAYMVFTGTYIV